MKKLLYSLVLFVAFCSCSADTEGLASGIAKWSKDEDLEFIDRPCSVKDLNCIRRFFSQYSRCKMAYGPVPEPFYVKQMVLPLANSNMTFILNDAEVKGLNGKITSFYVNKKSNNLVVAVEIQHPTFYTPNAELRYYRKGKEPIALADAFFITYASITFTATIPNYKKLQLANAEIYTYIDDSDPPYAIGPNVIKSFDPDVLKSFNKLVTNVPENAKEAFVTIGPMIMSTIIQYNICNFGLNLEQ